MPNHVETHLTIDGDKKQLKEFREKHITIEKDGDRDIELFNFQTVIPMPAELEGTTSPRPKTIEDAKKAFFYGDESEEEKEKIIEKRVNQVKNSDKYIKEFGADNWYDWCVSHWGTKWGAYNSYISDESEDCLKIDYQTAWSPATPVLQKLSEMYPKLNFRQTILDEGMFFGGEQIWSDGVYTERLLDGDELYIFCNEEFGSSYAQCKCGEWYEPEWLNDGYDTDKCWDCNEDKVKEKEENN